MIIKTGIGYDIHRLIKGRRLVLGGVEIHYEKGLDGHSDADVVLHAICDALLGAAGKGDIGEHFPNTDQKYKNISSLILLQQVDQVIKQDNYQIQNIDVIIQIQAPKIKEYKASMRSAIAKAVNISDDCVNIKATTQEELGAIGKGEGIAAFASVLLTRK